MSIPLFPRWSNSVFRWSAAGIAVTLMLIPCLLMATARSPIVSGQYQMVEQPVEFDHRHHVRDDGVDCRYCHEGAERSAYAGVPPTSRCMNCHNQVWARAGLLDPVRSSYVDNIPIHWRRVHALPAFVFFNHAAHTTRGIGCASCHGRVDEMAKVYQVAPLTMSWCLDCHRHPEQALRPSDRIYNMEWMPSDREQERIGAELAQSLAIAPPLHCSGCHR